MENKDGLCEAAVRKNLVLADMGEPLTMPLATLNKSCKFQKEWNRLQKVWHKKKVICPCGKEFTVSKGRAKYCSKECSKIQRKIIVKAYNERPDIIAKNKAHHKSPEVKAKARAYSKRPEIIARRKAYSQRPEVMAKLLAYRQDPEVKARARARARVYYERPEVKARRKEYQQRPEVMARTKAARERPAAQAKIKANYEKNRERILLRRKEEYAIKKANTAGKAEN